MKNQRLQFSLAAFSLMLAIGTASQAAGITDVSQQPLLTSSGAVIKPNLLFVLDDSGSMASGYLPEAAAGSRFRYAHRSSQCNGLAYDPNTTYEKPMAWDRTDVADASGAGAFNADVDMQNARATNQGSRTVSAADGSPTSFRITLANGWNTWYAVGRRVTVYDDNGKQRWGLGTVTEWVQISATEGRLSVRFDATLGAAPVTLISPKVADGDPIFVYYKYSGAPNTRLAYTYSNTGGVITGTDFFKECNSVMGTTPGSNVFKQRIILSNASPGIQNYYNWFEFHRNRMKMMKTVVSRAFSAVDDRFRVGFNTILNKVAQERLDDGRLNRRFLHVRDFKEVAEGGVPSQREKFYTALNTVQPTNTTPLRAALSFAGRYYANKLGDDQDYDPIQYSCQKNFMILSSDGAWNTDDESDSYRPLQLDGSTLVGQQDSAAQMSQEWQKVFRDKGYSDSLADVAMYYYNTDLRTKALGNCTGNIDGVDVCNNNVKQDTVNDAAHQHLITYTLSLGQNGSITYDKDYPDQASGPYFNIKQGTNQWPNPTTAAYKVDDLWHAAVNGRGRFFNGSDASSVADGIRTALATISGQTGSGAAAATSTLRPVAGNNFAYIAEFSTGDWQGDVRAYEIRLADGDIQRTARDEQTGEDGQIWSAAKVLNAGGFKRNLFMAKAGQLAPFSYDNLKDSGHFDGKCNLLAQCIALSDAEKTLANDGKNLVAYLAGQSFDAIYRKRKSLMGDVVSSAPVYDGALAAQYTDAGYAAFANARKDRLPVVYVGANDGFMHAFYAGPKTETLTPGQELWAFSPTAVHKNLYLLATEDYATRHRYYVDGPATLADIHNGVEWRTILVFGLGAGGNQYTALDVTNPAEPKLLWEFTDKNLGMTHAKPIITKRKSNGSWVVAVPSGFNNTGVGADGKGHLFLIDAATGAKVADIATSKGDKDNPSGLGPLNSWVEADSDNTALRYYAGDNDGNVWRFDTEGLVEPKNAALLLAQLGSKQAVTTMPAMAEVDYKGVKSSVVYVGTGRSVGVSDLSSADLQSIYGIRDQLTNVGWGVVRGSGLLVEQKLQIDGSGKRTVTKNPVDWAKDAGWQVDLTDPQSQRINVPMQLFGNTLIAAANVPVAEGGLTCEAGGFGSAYIYYIDIATGGADDIDLFSESQIAGFTILTLPSGKHVASIIPVKGDDETNEVKPAAAYGNKASRANWRTLTGR